MHGRSFGTVLLSIKPIENSIKDTLKGLVYSYSLLEALRVSGVKLFMPRLWKKQFKPFSLVCFVRCQQAYVDSAFPKVAFSTTLFSNLLLDEMVTFMSMCLIESAETLYAAKSNSNFLLSQVQRNFIEVKSIVLSCDRIQKDLEYNIQNMAMLFSLIVDIAVLSFVS
ncbi:hypothetical protein Tco_0033339 [Tanacetum coccineum]